MIRLLAAISISMLSTISASAALVVVEKGDTLSGISQKYLSEPNRWPEICKLNYDALTGNCDIIPVGLTLTLPDSGSALSVGASAVEAAPTAPATDSDTGTNLIQSPENLALVSDWPVKGVSVISAPDGGFELVTDGTPDPRLLQSIPGDPAGSSFRVSLEARAGKSADIKPAIKIFAYSATQGSPFGATIQSKSIIPLTDDYVEYSFEVKFPVQHAGQSELVFRIDPADADEDGTNNPPSGYSVFVRNPKLTQMPS